MRRFVIIGHRAMSQGKLPISDLASGAGRVDVLVRAIMASLLTSHGIRQDTEVIIHLQGGPGPYRRIKFVGQQIRGMHAEERSVAGIIAKIIKQPTPPIGIWRKVSEGLYESGGDIYDTIREHSESKIVVLDADQESLWSLDAKITNEPNRNNGLELTFILSDDKPLELEIQGDIVSRSIGSQWLQGHIAIGICHFLLDQNVLLNLD